MGKALYWLSDAEWARIEPLMPRGRKGAHRVDDRRVISGIVHMLRSGARWRDCPPAYGPYTTIYNRFNRWSRQGIWFEMFEQLTGSSGITELWRSTVRRSRFTARPAAEKGAIRTGHRPLARRPDNQDPRTDRR
jgi:transposase